jgi:phosphate transport system substrate-binding protein
LFELPCLSRSISIAKTGFIGAIALIVSALPGFTAPAVLDQPSATLTIGGTGSALGAMSLLASEFTKVRPDIHVTVLPSLGSGGGIKALADGSIDLAVSTRPLKQAENDKGLRASEYARTPMVFATRQDNSAEGTSLEQTVSLYSGDHQTWPDGTPVRLIMRPENESDTDLIRAISPEMDAAVQSALQRKELHVAINDQDNATALEKIPGSLGVIPLAQIMTEQRRIKPLVFDDLEGTVEALKAGNYPYAKEHYIVSKSDPGPEAQAFLDFIASPEGQEVLRVSGHVVADATSNSKM